MNNKPKDTPYARWAADYKEEARRGGASIIYNEKFDVDNDGRTWEYKLMPDKTMGWICLGKSG